MNHICLQIEGNLPAPTQGSHVRRWRLAIARKCKLKRSLITDKIDRSSNRFYVSANFFVPTLDKSADLDNLAKPLLDTIFLNKYAKLKALTGALFCNATDRQIVSLSLHKEETSELSSIGVHVKIEYD